MNSENSTAKQLSELSFWALRYLQNGEKPLPGDAAADKYCAHLGIQRDTFAGRIVLDIGCGPVGSLDQFAAKLKFGVDVLSRSYVGLGVQAHEMVYLASPVENLPFIDDFIDDVISLNALDHVDNFEAAIREIHRVLKPDGRVYLAFNLDHTPTVQEPQFLTQDRISQALSGLFVIGKSYISQLPEAWQSSAPGGMFVIHASKIPKISKYQEQVDNLIKRFKTTDVTLEALDVEYISTYGAPAAILAERASANAFLENRERRDGWERRLLNYVRIAVTSQPTVLFNKGVLSILRNALLSLVGLHKPAA